MRKLISGVMASLLLVGSFTVFTACDSKKKKEREVIQESDNWYSCSKVDILANCHAADYSHFHFFETVVADDLVFTTYNAYQDWGDGSVVDPICVFDMEGNLLTETNIRDEITLFSPIGVVNENDKAVLYYQSEGKLMKAEYNKSSNKFEDHREVDIGGDSVQFSRPCKACGDYVFFTGLNHGVNYLYVIKDGALIASDEMNADFHPEIDEVIPKEDGFQLRFDWVLYFFSTSTLDVKADGVYSMGPDYVNKEAVGTDGKVYTKENDGIYVDGEPYLMYSETDCNPYLFMVSDLMSVTEESVTLSYTSTKSGYESDIILHLTKQASNPNAGKTVITARSYGNSIDEMTGEGIVNFNKENKDYFIKYTSISEDISEDEDALEKYDQQFKEEITSSEAADIYFGIDTMWWFQKEDYFVDLKKELDLDPNIYYTNIIDSASRDGKLFYMPLGFVSAGLWTDASNVSEGTKGFTYDEYVKFVSTVGNGSDAISEYFDRDEYFAQCFSMMNDTWFKDGKVNITNEQFESMCRLFVDNVPEKKTVSDDDFILGSYQYNTAYSYDIVEPWYSCFIYDEFDEPVLLGVPTTDGRGPGAYISASVSVSASSDLKDVCCDFIRTLISKDVQEFNTYNPINREAMPRVLDTSIEFYINTMKSNTFISEAELAWLDSYPAEKMKNSYIANMEKVEVVLSSDPSIEAIVHEELSSVYAGEKDISEAAKTMEDRLKTLYNEKN